MAELMPYQKPLLDAVLAKIGNSDDKIEDVVDKVLDQNKKTWRGVNYGYLSRTLCAAAKARIRRRKKQGDREARPALVLTP